MFCRSQSLLAQCPFRQWHWYLIAAVASICVQTIRVDDDSSLVSSVESSGNEEYRRARSSSVAPIAPWVREKATAVFRELVRDEEWLSKQAPHFPPIVSPLPQPPPIISPLPTTGSNNPPLLQPPTIQLEKKCSGTLTERHELDCWYGHGAPPNVKKEAWSAMMVWWHAFATKHSIVYSLAYGSYLGYWRHPQTCFVPGDSDIDIFVDAEAATILDALAADPSQTDVSFLGKTKSSVEPRIAVYPNNSLPLTDEARPRYTCKDVQISGHAGFQDRCSFNGNSFRVLFPGNNWIDALPYYLVKNGTPDPPGSVDCWTFNGMRSCTYVKPPDSLGLQVEPCSCAGVDMSCFQALDGEYFLNSYYNGFGKGDFRSPAMAWVNGNWTATGVRRKGG